MVAKSCLYFVNFHLVLLFFATIVKFWKWILKIAFCFLLFLSWWDSKKKNMEIYTKKICKYAKKRQNSGQESQCSGQVWKEKVFFFFWIGINSMQDWIATTRHGVMRKRSTKRLKHTGNLFRKNLQLKDVC